MLSQTVVFVLSLFGACAAVWLVESITGTRNILRDVIVFVVWLVLLSALGIVAFCR